MNAKYWKTAGAAGLWLALRGGVCWAETPSGAPDAVPGDGATAELGNPVVGGTKSWSEAKERFNAFALDPLRATAPVTEPSRMLPGDGLGIDCSALPLLDKPLALAEAVDLALCANPQVRVSWAQLKAGAASLGEAKAAYLPQVSAGLSRVRDRTTYAGTNLESQTLQDTSRNVGLTWRLFDFGARGANQAVASATLDAAMAAHDANLQQLLQSVIGAYFDAQSAWVSLDAKLEQEKLAASTLATAKRREASGAGAQTDTLQAATAAARASLERSRATGDLDKAMAVLGYSMGLQPGTAFKLAQDAADEPAGSEQQLADWLAQAQAQHPAILAARAQLEAARHRVTSARVEGLPTLDLGVNQYRNGRPNQGLPTIQSNERVIALTLSVPLFEGFARTYKIRGAQAGAEQKEAELQDTEHQVLMNVVKAHADAAASLNNLTASRDLFNAAQLAAQSVQRKLDRGASDLMEMLSAQFALADASQQQLRSQAEWRSARLRLFAAAGRMGRWTLGR